VPTWRRRGESKQRPSWSSQVQYHRSPVTAAGWYRGIEDLPVSLSAAFYNNGPTVERGQNPCAPFAEYPNQTLFMPKPLHRVRGVAADGRCRGASRSHRTVSPPITSKNSAVIAPPSSRTFASHAASCEGRARASSPACPPCSDGHRRRTASLRSSCRCRRLPRGDLAWAAWSLFCQVLGRRAPLARCLRPPSAE
jgi:hypothetical protein